MSVKVGDSTGEAWVSIFNEQAEALIGMSADELAQIKEEVSFSINRLACVPLSMKTSLRIGRSKSPSILGTSRSGPKMPESPLNL